MKRTGPIIIKLKIITFKDLKANLGIKNVFTERVK